MGFVAEELNETERLYIQRNKVNNMAVVYGKDASMWKVSHIDSIFVAGFVFSDFYLQVHSFYHKINSFIFLRVGFSKYLHKLFPFRFLKEQLALFEVKKNL